MTVLLGPGDIENARGLEAFSLLWVVYSNRFETTQHAFKLEGRELRHLEIDAAARCLADSQQPTRTRSQAQLAVRVGLWRLNQDRRGSTRAAGSAVAAHTRPAA